MRRCEYIGGSDAAALLGLTDYQTLYDVYYRKRYKVDVDLDTSDIRRGITFEPIVRELIAEDLNIPISEEKFLFDEDLRIGGHPDAQSDDAVFEIKCPRMITVKNYKSHDEIVSFEELHKTGLPARYYAQLQHYLMLTGKRKGAIVIFDYDNMKNIYVWVDADDALHEHMRTVYREFWNAVDNGLEFSVKPYEGGETFSRGIGGLDEAAEMYKEATEAYYHFNKLRKTARTQLLSYRNFTGNDKMLGNDWMVSFSDVVRPNYSYVKINVKRRE